MQKFVTLTEFLLNEEHLHPIHRGNLTLLLTTIENAGKIIASHLKKTGLADLLGKTGNINSSGDEVKKMDMFANDTLVSLLTQSNQVATIASEELETPINTQKKDALFDVYLDPLDGSHNVDTNMVMGTIFSIYRHSKKLQKGTYQIAAGYILYGSAVVLVLSTGHGVQGFTLDPAMGCFLLSHPSFHIPKHSPLYHVNDANITHYDEKAKQFIEILRAQEGAKQRWIGVAVAELHCILINGGIFLYPADQKNINGKLRLMYEVNPLGFLIEQAGGIALSGGQNALGIAPEKVDQKVPFVFGSSDLIRQYQKTVWEKT